MKTRTVKLILIATTLIALAGCSAKRDAIGFDNEIIVITTRPHFETVRNALKIVFNDTLYTPQPEAEYKLKFAGVEEFDRYNTHANLIIVGLGMEDLNPGNQLVRNFLSPNNYMKSKKGESAIFISYDTFAEKQLFQVISARDEEHLVQALSAQKDWLKGQFDELFEKRQAVFLYERVSQKDIEDNLFSDHGWGIKVPWGYIVLKDSSDIGFFWMGREHPYRWISVQWQDGQKIFNRDEALARTISYADEFYDSMRFIDFRINASQVDFKNWNAWRVTGLWEKTDEPQGGPFVHYIFYDGLTDRTYQINSLVFFPGEEKSVLIKQLEIVARSFFVEQQNEGPE